jgi:DNA-directed RNA polymerase subunit RPC12/RpoP
MGIYIALATRGRMARMRERTREYRTIGMKPAAAARQAYDDEFAAEPSLPASQKGEYECLECGAKVRAGDLKCPECGSEDVAAAMAGKKTIECPLCGARVPEDTTKCSECGAQFEQEG